MHPQLHPVLTTLHTDITTITTTTTTTTTATHVCLTLRYFVTVVGELEVNTA